jgi:hypothetical protein
VFLIERHDKHLPLDRLLFLSSPSLDSLVKWYKLIHDLFLAVTVPLIAGGLAYDPLDHQIGIWHTGAEKRNGLE